MIFRIDDGTPEKKFKENWKKNKRQVLIGIGSIIAFIILLTFLNN